MTLSSVHGNGAALSAHKLSNHDVVAIRPNKGDSSGPPIGRGVVYFVADAFIKVALDEPPEEALEGTLRLEKLANEVCEMASRPRCEPLPFCAPLSANLPRPLPVSLTTSAVPPLFLRR